ncbi:MAG TPA: hypothetical protein VNK49_07420 [Anaerolineales bacterium]|nr:hypothetical protein [Anaerolineales bacterium]
MTRLIVSTNCRGVLYNETSGWLYVIDLGERRILQKTKGIEPPFRARDVNPRGGMRGMRGMSIYSGEIAVANYSTVFFFDRRWNFLRAFTHPSISAIHEILCVKDGVWVTSTANDLLAKFDLYGKLTEFHLIRQQVDVMKQLRATTRRTLRPQDILKPKVDFRRRSYFNSDLYDRTHLNSLAVAGDGRVLLLLGLIVNDYFSFLMNIKTLLLKLKVWDIFLSFNRVLRAILHLEKPLHSELILPPAKGKSAVLCFDDSKPWEIILQCTVAHNPSHSIRVLRDGTCIYLDTSSGAIVHFNMQGNVLSNTPVTQKFLRGACELWDGQLVVGAGNTLLLFGLAERKIVDQIELSNDPSESVFDIKILPPDFHLPPESLEAITGHMIGFDGERILWTQEKR